MPASPGRRVNFRKINVKVKIYHIIIWSLVVLISAGIFAIPILFSEHLGFINRFIVAYPLIAPLIIIFFKMSAIIFPPLTGSIIGLAGIPLFGWWQALIYDAIGSMSGAVIAFLIARRFRERIVARFTLLQNIGQWEKKLPENLEFWGFFTIRLSTEFIFDILSYAAGLTRIRFWRYFLATLFGSLPIKFLIFYFGGISFSKGIYLIIAFLVLLGIISIWFKKSKYYEHILKPEKSSDD